MNNVAVLGAVAAIADKEALRRKACEIISQLKYWAERCPAYREALTDCVDELYWIAELKAGTPVTGYQNSGLKHGASQIVTNLQLWAEVYPALSRSLRSCAAEIRALGQRLERKDEKRRARDIVLQALTQFKCPMTSVAIVEETGLPIRRTQRALECLIRLGFVKDDGCGARTPEEGNRTRRYALTHTMP